MEPLVRPTARSGWSARIYIGKGRTISLGLTSGGCEFSKASTLL